jgi:hypothetical protein
MNHAPLNRVPGSPDGMMWRQTPTTNEARDRRRDDHSEDLTSPGPLQKLKLNLIYGSAARRKRNLRMEISFAQIYPALHLERGPRAIMDIRAQLAFLHGRPQKGPVRLSGPSCGV